MKDSSDNCDTSLKLDVEIVNHTNFLNLIYDKLYSRNNKLKELQMIKTWRDKYISHNELYNSIHMEIDNFIFLLV